jgi:hypothetical protein
LVIFLFASAENSFACSCLISSKSVKKQVKKAYKDSNAIFSGEVIEIRDDVEEGMILVKLKVAEFWKGDLQEEITITTYRESTMCGFIFEVGKKYLVYAYGLKDNFTTNNCSRTTSFSDNKDVKYLAKLMPKKKKSK